VLVDHPYSGIGPKFSDLRLETRLDGKFVPNLLIKGVELGDSVEQASEKIYQHWWQVQAVPLFTYLSNAAPALTFEGIDVWTTIHAGGTSKPGQFPATLENHTAVLTIAKKVLAKIRPGEIYTATAMRMKQPSFRLAQNWDGGWLVEQGKGKSTPVTPTSNLMVSGGGDAGLSLEMDKLMRARKVTEEFRYGYVLVKKAP
jgi:hypothetical protein